MFLVGTDCNKLSIHFSETDKRVLIPSANSLKYINALNCAIEKFKIEFLHAQPDSEIAVISENRNKIDINMFLPQKKTIKLCHDKFKTNKILKRKNVPVAETIRIRNKNDLKKAFEKIDLPLWIRATKGAGGKGSLLVREGRHAESWVDYWDGWRSFLASEYLSGANFGWDAIFNDGELICCQAKQRLEYALKGASPSGITGTTGVAKSIRKEDINEIAEKAVYAIDQNPCGVFSVDLKESKEKIPCVTEINPGRFLSSSLHFFYTTKCLFPYVYIKLAFGEKVPTAALKGIDPGVILIRNLDAKPKLLTEKTLTETLD